MQFRIHQYHDHGFAVDHQSCRWSCCLYPHLMAFVPFANVLLRERMVKLKMFILDHWLINLLSKNSHMDLTTKLCSVNFSIMQLSSDERICFNASCVELDWLYWTLITLVDLWTLRMLWLLDFLSLFLNLTWNWVCLVDGNISPSPNLGLDWVTMVKMLFTDISSHNLMYHESVLS